MDNIFVKNQVALEQIKKNISQGGVNNFHVIADFDQTLTKSFVNGEAVPSMIGILRSADYLGSEYTIEAKALANKYSPIERDPHFDLLEKKKAMEQWWRQHFALLIKHGLCQKHLQIIIDSPLLVLREGVGDLIKYLHKNNIPLVIMSASGVGGQLIIDYLKKHDLFFDNIAVISNNYIWDEEGRAISVTEPIIHSLNKDDTMIHNFPVYEKIKNRKNVLLLGDSLSDVGMIKGFDYQNLLKVGFLNEKVEEHLGVFQENFDIVMANDASAQYICDLVKNLF